jgi:cytochrome c oxidase subunit III
MSDDRRIIDLSKLPKVVFDHHSLVWWGTVGFILIEGFTLLLAIAAYFYLRINEIEWPPGRTPAPDLLIPTVNTILLLLIMVPMRAADKAARHFNKPAVVKWLTVALAMTLVAIVLRWFEILALHVKWDAHAYASAAWAVIVLHSTLLIADLGEALVFIAMFTLGRARMKHYPDVSDAAFYQYFLSLSYVPIYVIIYWGPRFF